MKSVEKRQGWLKTDWSYHCDKEHIAVLFTSTSGYLYYSFLSNFDSSASQEIGQASQNYLVVKHSQPLLEYVRISKQRVLDVF